jgi:hypothetical protein
VLTARDLQRILFDAGFWNVKDFQIKKMWATHR